MNKDIKITKFAFLFGAIIDGFWAIVLAFPSLYVFITRSDDIEFNTQIRVIFIIASSLMFGWTFLLLWGYQKPIERRTILLLTAFPVVFGIFLGTLISLSNGNTYAIIFLTKTALIIFVMIWGYIKAGRIAKSSK